MHAYEIKKHHPKGTISIRYCTESILHKRTLAERKFTGQIIVKNDKKKYTAKTNQMQNICWILQDNRDEKNRKK